MKATNELKICFSPTFFANLCSKNAELNKDEIISKYEENSFDQYAYIKQNTSVNLLSSFKEIRYIPLSNSVLDYEADVWDFSTYTLVSKHHSTIYFSTVCDVFKDDLKNYLLLTILQGQQKNK